MRALTRKLPTNRDLHFDIDEEPPMSSDEAIRIICGDRPEWAVALRGLRFREGLTQKALGEQLGVEHSNISKMELGKRPIGKTIAKSITKLFKSDYRIFL